jgi:hypothetical protein
MECLMYGDDSKDTGWIRVAPGVALEVEWETTDYRIAAHGDDEVSGKLTGRVRMTRDAAFEANWGTSLTDEGGVSEG